jgi:ketosteroid isomerase-like protein
MKNKNLISRRVLVKSSVLGVISVSFDNVLFGKGILDNTVNRKAKNKHMTTTEKEILAIVKAWNDSFTRNDNETYFTYIHDDLTLFIPSSPYRIDGKQDDKDEFDWSLSTSRTKVHFFQEMQPKIQIYGDTAVVTYHNRGALNSTNE